MLMSYLRCERMEIPDVKWAWEVDSISKIMRVYLRSLTFFLIYLLARMPSRIVRLSWLFVLTGAAMSLLVMILLWLARSIVCLPNFASTWHALLSFGSVSSLLIATLTWIPLRWQAMLYPGVALTSLLKVFLACKGSTFSLMPPFWGLPTKRRITCLYY